MLIDEENVRGYDCQECKIHFEAETTHGDAHEYDPDCPKCGDPTGFNCIPCFGDPRNDSSFPAVTGSQAEPVLAKASGCLFPNSRHQGIVRVR